MQKLLIIFSFFGLGTGASSCTRDWNCDCAGTITVIHDTKARAETACDARSTYAYKCALQ